MTATNLISCSKHLHPCQTKERSKDLTDPLGLGPAANRAWHWWIIIRSILICMTFSEFSRCDSVVQVLGQNVTILQAVLSQSSLVKLDFVNKSLCDWICVLEQCCSNGCLCPFVSLGMWTDQGLEDVWRRHSAQWDGHWNPGTNSNVVKPDQNPPWGLQLCLQDQCISADMTHMSKYHKVTDWYMPYNDLN